MDQLVIDVQLPSSFILISDQCVRERNGAGGSAANERTRTTCALMTSERLDGFSPWCENGRMPNSLKFISYISSANSQINKFSKVTQGARRQPTGSIFTVMRIRIREEGEEERRRTPRRSLTCLRVKRVFPVWVI